MGGLKKVIRIVDDSSKILFVFYICVADAMIAGWMHLKGLMGYSI